MEVIKGRDTHVGNDRLLSNMGHRVFDVLFDKSTVSGVIKCGGSSARIRRAGFPKLDDFITEDKTKPQGIRASENGR